MDMRLGDQGVGPVGQPGGPRADREDSGVMRRLGWAVLLNAAFIAVELAAGVTVNSLALIGDAWHNTTDVLALGVTWLAIRLMRRPPDSLRTFGYHRVGILAALGNSVLLGVVTLQLFLEAFRRLWHPSPPIGGGVILVVAAVGVVLNGTVAWILRRTGSDLNLRGAFLHMLGDALISLAVVGAGACLLLTGWAWPDPAAGLLVGVYILIEAWRIAREAVNVLMEGTPKDLDLVEVSAAIARVPGVREVHHLHVWSLNEELTALSCHVIVDDQPVSAGGLLVSRIERALRDRFRISHATVQLEPALQQPDTPLSIQQARGASRP
jgi:cobalt-zinc-cadmium efflux system protein